MRATTKELVKLTALLVVVFLVLAHYKGAVSVLGTGARGWGGIIRDFQGRGHF